MTEAKGRLLFDKLSEKIFKGLETINYTTIEDAERYDATVETKTKSYIVEIKTRNLTHDQYSTAFMKEDKRINLMNGLTDGYNPLFVCFYDDGYALVWDLTTATMGSIRNITAKNPVKGNAYETKPHRELLISEAYKIKL
jgi:hypothetical protein